MNLDVKNTVEALDDVKAQIVELKTQLSAYEDHLLSLVKEEADVHLSDCDYGCGTAIVDIEGYRVKVEVSKDVKYDASGLRSLYDQILQSGKDPEEYMKVKLDVSETAYKNWPEHIRSFFEPHRTVKQSKPKLSYKKLGA
jgi:regulator of replication initiation timing